MELGKLVLVTVNTKPISEAMVLPGQQLPDGTFHVVWKNLNGGTTTTPTRPWRASLNALQQHCIDAVQEKSNE